jgi:fatty-acyl-CoA synthase
MSSPSSEHTLGALYRRWAALGPDDLVAVFVDRSGQHRHTRRDVVRAVSAEAKAMREVGVGRGDRVVIAYPTSLDFVAAFWATQVLGAVAVPAWSPPASGPLRGEARLWRMLEVAGARAIAVDSASYRRLQEARPGALPALVAVTPPGTAGHHLDPGDSPARPDDLALLQFTSGSTSTPRGCALTHAAVVGNVERLANRFRVAPREVGVSWCPLHHDMGLIGGVVFPVCRDVISVLQRAESFMSNPLSWLRLIADHSAVITTAPNFALALVNRKLRGEAPDLDLSSLREIINGGEPIEPDVARQFVATLEPCRLAPSAMHAAYGLAEHVVLAASARGGLREASWPPAGAVGARPTGAGGTRRVVCVGRPLPETELRIVDDGRECGDGEAGEVLLRSPSLLCGYWSEPDATKEALVDGWFHTGDLGFRLAGELYILGRMKELIIVAGRNVLPADVEAAAASIDGVRMGGVAACGADLDGTEGVVVLAEYRGADGDAARRGIAAACRRDLDVTPRQVVLVAKGSLPKTTSGKIRRLEARRRYEAGALVDRFEGE